MTRSDTKHVSLEQAVRSVPDGAVVALAGAAQTRQPMAILREVVRQKKRGLRLVGYRDGMDFDMLRRAGCASDVDVPASAGSEEAAQARFEAGAAGLPYAIIGMAGEGAVTKAIALHDAAGNTVMAVPKINPDIAILHAHAADIHGNVLMDLETCAGFARDVIVARSAARVIVSVEQIVSPQTLANAPARLVLAADTVDMVVEAPYGAYPTQCERRYDGDDKALAAYDEAARDAGAFRQWLEDEVDAKGSHALYLDRLGMERLQAITTRRSA